MRDVRFNMVYFCSTQKSTVATVLKLLFLLTYVHVNVYVYRSPWPVLNVGICRIVMYYGALSFFSQIGQETVLYSLIPISMIFVD